MSWEKNCSVFIISYSKHHIDANVEIGGDGVIWTFTGFYGETDTTRRKITGALLKLLKSFFFKGLASNG